MLSSSLRRLFRGRWKDEDFEKILEIDFWRDFDVTMQLQAIPSWEKTKEQLDLLNILREKYRPDGSCPSTLFPDVSLRLQREYQRVHSAICSFLYPQRPNYSSPE
ncbi:hypothetical protein HYT51_01340 [Candidatus Woesearchaeota archaeon]|nr:hypothetical protein [Candidatus Woesearchaeota archaeon]